MVSEVFLMVDWGGELPIGDMAARVVQELRYPGAGAAKNLLDLPDIAVYGIESTYQEAGSHNHVRPLPGHDVIVHGNVYGGLDPAKLAANFSATQFRAYVPDGLFNLLVWTRATQSLAVSPDLVGVKPLYYWRGGTTLVLSSALKAFRSLPFLPVKLNPSAVAGLLTERHPGETDTLFEGVQLIPADHTALFRRETTQFSGRGTVEFRDPPSKTSTAALVEALDAVMQASTAVAMQGHEAPVISLSGGLDSRLVLGHTARLTPHSVAASWGAPDSDDLQYAEALAKLSGIDHLQHLLTETSPVTEDSLGFPAWWAESLGVSSVPFYWEGWLALLRAQNRPVAHGFLGGFLAGGTLGKWGLPRTVLSTGVDAAWPSLNGWVPATPSKLLMGFATPRFRQALTTDYVARSHEAFRQLPGEMVYQRVRYRELIGRQRRYLGNAVFSLTDMFLPTIVPFYTRQSLDFFINLPLDALWDRYLVRRALAEKFPALAHVPEANTGKLAVVSSPRIRLIKAARDNALLLRLFPHLRPKQSSDIFLKLLNGHLPIFTRTFRRAHEVLADQLDLNALARQLEADGVPRNERGTLVVLFNLCYFLNEFYGR